MLKRYSFIRGPYSLSNCVKCCNAMLATGAGLSAHLNVVLPPGRGRSTADLHHAIVLRLNLEIAHNALIARRFLACTEEQSRKGRACISSGHQSKSLAGLALAATLDAGWVRWWRATDPFYVPPVAVAPDLVVAPTALNLYAGVPAG